MNLFESLGLPPTLCLDLEEIEACWRARSKDAHPDAIPSAGKEPGCDIAQINEARDVLSSPVGRLGEWLRLREVDPSQAGGAISSGMMDLFSAVGKVLADADAAIAAHRKAQTALQKSLLTATAIAAQQALQGQMGELRAATDTVVATFPEIEAAAEEASGSHSAAIRAYGELKFLSKWEKECQQRLLSLIGLD